MADFVRLLFDSGYAGLIAGFLATLASGLWWWQGGPFRELEKYPERRERILDELRQRLKHPKGLRFYEEALQELLVTADHFFGQKPWDVVTFERMLIFALIYPILSAFIGWVFLGDTGQIGKAIGLVEFHNVNLRLFMGVWWGSLFLLFLFFHKINNRIKRVFLGLFLAFLGWFGLYAFNFFSDEERLPIAFYGAVTIAGAIAIFLVIYKLVVSNVLGAVAFGGAIATVGVISGFKAFVFYFFFGSLFFIVGKYIKDKHPDKYGMFILCIYMFYLVAAYALMSIPQIVNNHRITAVILGLALLPLVNAPFDWLSTGLTRWLLRKSLKAEGVLKRLAYSTVDFLAALAILVALAVTMVVAIEGVNAAAGHTVADVEGLIEDIRANPLAGRHFWVYFTLFSTLLPTLIHADLAVMSLIGMRLPFRQLALGQLTKAAKGVDEINALRLVRAALTARWLMATVLVFIGAGVLGYIIVILMGLGGLFAEFLLRVVVLVQSFFGLPAVR